MLIGIAVIVTSLFYGVMVYIIYSTKRKLNNAENKIYNFLLKISLLGLLLELGCCYFVSHKDMSSMFSIMNVIVNKFFLIYMLTWILIFTLYIALISFFNDEKTMLKYRKKIISIFGISYFVLMLLLLILPTYYHYDGTYVYSFGPSTNVISVIGGLTILFDFYCLFKNFKQVSKKKYYPLFVLILLMVFALVLRSINPGLIFINSVFAFITVLMYFTIENPDVYMLGQLYKAKEHAENSNNEKSLFLFKVTQRLKEPLKEINRLSKEALMESDQEKIKENLQEIKYSSNTSLALVNDVLDISELENRKISLGNHKYQSANLFNKLAKATQLQIKDKPIELRFNYDQSIPEYLSGDSLRIKQIASTLLENAVTHTGKGFIEFNINSVTKHDICRLIIVIEDSGKGIEVEKVSHLFDKPKTDAYQNYDIDDSQKNLVFIKTLVDLIGGTITVNSEVGKGTKFTVVIDQKIPTEQKDQLSKSVEQYENIYINQDQILIVTSDEKVSKKLTPILKREHFQYDIVSNGQECLEKIRNQEKYKLILIDEELPKLSSVHTFEKLKMIDSFHIPVVLMIKHKDIENRESYMNMGFQDTIDVLIHKEDVKQVLGKYMK